MTRADLVRRCWAPESLAVRWLRARRLAAPLTKRQRDALRKRKGREPHHRARERDRLAAALLPATTIAVAERLGVTVSGAKVVLARLGARVDGEADQVDARGTLRARPLWRMP